MDGQAQQAVRVLAFGERTALEWSRLMRKGTAADRPRSALDTVPVATAATHSPVLAELLAAWRPTGLSD